MDNAVHGCDGGMGEVMIPELHCVRYLCRAGSFCHNCVSVIVLQSYTNIPARCTAEFPRMYCLCLFVCDYVTTMGPDGCIVILERSVVV